jgi:NAD-dependent SIR2 family protein deacetylase
MNNLTID